MVPISSGKRGEIQVGLYYTGTNGLGGENRKDLTKKEDTSKYNHGGKFKKYKKPKNENKKELD